MTARLDAFPRVPLAHQPTPLERLPRLGEALGGAEIWVKRDDCTGLATGGNKARKLEYLLGAALEEGADTIITVGGVQSNHARQTAAACARLGLRCQLVLPRVVPMGGDEYERGGNVLLDGLLGAEVFIVDDEAAAARRIQALMRAADEEGRRVAVFPAGGSTPVGSLGYVRAAFEVAEQIEAGAPRFGRVHLAVSTAGTLAGLVAGTASGAWRPRFTAVCVSSGADKPHADLERLLAGVSELLEEPSFRSDAVDFEEGFLGEGYGVPAASTLEAIELCARTEGLLLDPVYTGKAMAALIADVRSGRPGAEPALFWHTGGAAGLFAYREVLDRGATP